MADTKRAGFLSLRLPRETIRRLDALKKRSAVRNLPAFEVKAPTRSAIARLALLRGLDQLERETTRTTTPKPAPIEHNPEPVLVAPQKKTTRKKKAKTGRESWTFRTRKPTEEELADPALAMLIDGEGFPPDYALDTLRERKGR